MARRKKVVEVKDVAYVKIEADTYVDVVEEGDGKLYGRRDCTAKTTTIHGIKDVGKDGYYDIPVNFKLEEGTDYYLVYVNYDTGDSFGYDTGQICYVDLFKSKEKAKALVDAIHENYESERWPTKKQSKPQPTQLDYVRDDGSVVTCYTGTWRGYFERMNYVEMEVVRTEQRYRKTVH